LWKNLQQRIEAVTGPSIWPVPTGFAVGAGLLGVVALTQPPSAVVPESAAKPAVASVENTQVQKLPIQKAQVSTQLRLAPEPAKIKKPRGMLLPPRPDAADITRRIEAGLPRRKTPPPQVVKKLQPVPPKAIKPRIAIVIDDMGFDRDNSARALRLPPQVTLAYLPYAPAVQAQVRRARLKGHPVMLHLPMEAPDHRGKPGVNVLSVKSDEAVIRTQLSRMLGRFGGYTGVNNHMGSRFTRDRTRMDIVLSELKKRGLFFLDSRTSGQSVGAKAAVAAGIPYAVRDVFLDHDPAVGKIRERLAETERIARSTGAAIAIGHPRTMTMKLLAPWVAGLTARGFELVRLDSLLKRPKAKKPPKKLAQAQTAE
jgi:uncharacterized protein